jgi:hypothetical protein
LSNNEIFCTINLTVMYNKEVGRSFTVIAAAVVAVAAVVAAAAAAVTQNLSICMCVF